MNRKAIEKIPVLRLPEAEDLLSKAGAPQDFLMFAMVKGEVRALYPAYFEIPEDLHPQFGPLCGGEHFLKPSSVHKVKVFDPVVQDPRWLTRPVLPEDLEDPKMVGVPERYFHRLNLRPKRTMDSTSAKTYPGWHDMKLDTKGFLRLLDSISPEAGVAAMVPSASAGRGGNEQGGLELRGNNLKVQFNILEAALIVMSESIEAGDGRKFIHASGKHRGHLNCSALAARIDEQRSRFPLLAPTSESGEELRPGADRDKIAE